MKKTSLKKNISPKKLTNADSEKLADDQKKYQQASKNLPKDQLLIIESVLGTRLVGGKTSLRDECMCFV